MIPLKDGQGPPNNGTFEGIETFIWRIYNLGLETLSTNTLAAFL